MKKNLLCGIVLALGLTACDPIRGILNVEQTLKILIDEPNNCNPLTPPCTSGKTAVDVNPGQYIMKLEMSGKRAVQISLKTASQSVVAKLNINKGHTLPEQGPFSLLSQESGQPFDLKGSVSTARKDSARKRYHETCEIPYTDTICTPQGCTTRSGVRMGYRDIVYVDRTTEKNMKASLADTATKLQLATYEGSASSVQRIYISRGHCFY